MKVIFSEDAKIKAAEDLSRLLSHNDKPKLVLLASGSWYSVYDHVSLPSEMSHITIGMVDERLSTDEDINNFAKFKNSEFYKKLNDRNALFIDTRPVESELIEDTEYGVSKLATRMQYEWKNWREHYADGEVIATIGVGADGHVVGMFATAQKIFKEDFLQTSNWVFGYDNRHVDGELRATATYPFLENINHVLVYVKSDGKEKMLEKFFTQGIENYHQPAQILFELGNAVMFTDFRKEEVSES